MEMVSSTSLVEYGLMIRFTEDSHQKIARYASLVAKLKDEVGDEAEWEAAYDKRMKAAAARVEKYEKLLKSLPQKTKEDEQLDDISEESALGKVASMDAFLSRDHPNRGIVSHLIRL